MKVLSTLEFWYVTLECRDILSTSAQHSKTQHLSSWYKCCQHSSLCLQHSKCWVTLNIGMTLEAEHLGLWWKCCQHSSVVSLTLECRGIFQILAQHFNHNTWVFKGSVTNTQVLIINTQVFIIWFKIFSKFQINTRVLKMKVRVLLFLMAIFLWQLLPTLCNFPFWWLTTFESHLSS